MRTLFEIAFKPKSWSLAIFAPGTNCLWLFLLQIRRFYLGICFADDFPGIFTWEIMRDWGRIINIFGISLLNLQIIFYYTKKEETWS